MSIIRQLQHIMHQVIPVVMTVCIGDLFMLSLLGKESPTMTASWSKQILSWVGCLVLMWPEWWHSCPSSFKMSHTHVLSSNGLPAQLMNQMRTWACGWLSGIEMQMGSHWLQSFTWIVLCVLCTWLLFMVQMYHCQTREHFGCHTHLMPFLYFMWSNLQITGFHKHYISFLMWAYWPPLIHMNCCWWSRGPPNSQGFWGKWVWKLTWNRCLHDKPLADCHFLFSLFFWPQYWHHWQGFRTANQFWLIGVLNAQNFNSKKTLSISLVSLVSVE